MFAASPKPTGPLLELASHAVGPGFPPGTDRALRVEERATWAVGASSGAMAAADIAALRQVIDAFAAGATVKPEAPCPYPPQVEWRLTVRDRSYAWATPCNSGKPAGADGLVAVAFALTAERDRLPREFTLHLPDDAAGVYELRTPNPQAEGGVIVSRIALRREHGAWAATYSSIAASAELHSLSVELAWFQAAPIPVKSEWPGYLPRSFEGFFVALPAVSRRPRWGLRLAGGEIFERVGE